MEIIYFLRLADQLLFIVLKYSFFIFFRSVIKVFYFQLWKKIRLEMFLYFRPVVLRFQNER